MDDLDKNKFSQSNIESIFTGIAIGLGMAVILILVLYILGFLFGWSVICETDTFLQDFGFWHTVWHGLKFFWGYILGLIIAAILTEYCGCAGAVLGIIIFFLLGMSV